MTTFLYDDPEHPDRVTGTVTTPEWTFEDRGLLLALEQYESTLCPGCGEPKDTAWHADADGHYEGHRFICQACTAAQGSEAVFHALAARPSAAVIAKFKPFDLLKSTAEPTKKEQ